MKHVKFEHRRYPIGDDESVVVDLAVGESITSTWVEVVPTDGRKLLNVLVTSEFTPEGDDGEAEDE